ncbi:MAG: FAD-dependent oxidoreductase [Candidatus Tectomicrobia bacterium]|nr:FAD-dependent oxidoreductase [Candidatus Tectomicrobia bacterium]
MAQARSYPARFLEPETYQERIPCQVACPVGTPAGRYVALIAEGRYAEAFAAAASTNPLVVTCSRICMHPCEEACRRGNFDAPVPIRALKRFAVEHGMPPAGASVTRPPLEPRRGRVAIIGAGPAGIAAARRLTERGFSVAIFETQRVAGGMLSLTVPNFRLGQEIVERDIAPLLAAGVEIRTGVTVGVDLSLEDLEEEGFEAIFLATGAGQAKKLPIEGSDLAGVHLGLDYLRAAKMGREPHLGEKVVIIGGGNAAMDVARTARRQAARLVAVGAAGGGGGASLSRQASPWVGAPEVHIVYYKFRHHMPASPEEIEAAQEEGIFLHPGRSPRRIVGEGRVSGLETVAVTSVFDEEGRYCPTYDEENIEILPADSVLFSVGQAPDLSVILGNGFLATTDAGTLKVDVETLATSHPGIFAGGDMAFGARRAIDAVADGLRAAAAIEAYLCGAPAMERSFHSRVYDSTRMLREHRYRAARPPRLLPVEERYGDSEVEIAFDEETARDEANRCLRCFVDTVFDSNACILCGGCVDVCPEDCLRLVRLDRLTVEGPWEEVLRARYGSSVAALREGAAILKHTDTCTRCALCADRCPTKAITMEMVEVREAPSDAKQPA